MRRRFEKGFTLVELAIALVLLAVGVLALVGSAAMATRMIGQGRQATLVAMAATARIEWLRQLAGSTLPRCIHPRFAPGAATARGIAERWDVAAAGNSRRIVLSLEYRVPRGVDRDSLVTAVSCR